MMCLYAYLAIGIAFVLATAKVRYRALRYTYVEYKSTQGTIRYPKLVFSYLMLCIALGLSLAVIVWPVLALDMVLTTDTYDWGDDA